MFVPSVSGTGSSSDLFWSSAARDSCQGSPSPLCGSSKGSPGVGQPESVPLRDCSGGSSGVDQSESVVLEGRDMIESRTLEV